MVIPIPQIVETLWIVPAIGKVITSSLLEERVSVALHDVIVGGLILVVCKLDIVTTIPGVVGIVKPTTEAVNSNVSVRCHRGGLKIHSSRP